MDKEDEKRQLISDYQWFKTPSGQNVLNNLKKNAHYNIAYFPHTNIFANGRLEAGQTDIYDVCREEGKRAVIVHIETMLNKDPNEKKGIKNE